MEWTYSQALDYIQHFDDPYLAALRNKSRQSWGLSTIGLLLESLGNPHLQYPVIHVAGTKGKGSTSAMIAACIAAEGYSVGLYTSPHLEDWRERIQINQQIISQDQVADITLAVKPFADEVAGLTAFEIGTALAFYFFGRQQVDCAVIEVGLGGRLDATNVVRPLVSVITNVSFDHMQFLGNTLASIAAEKADIIKSGCVAVSAPQDEEVLAVIEKRAESIDVPIEVVGREWAYEIHELSLDGSVASIGRPGNPQNFRIGLPGVHQVENAAVALAAVAAAAKSGISVSEKATEQGLAQVHWPGRMEVASRDPLIILDGAHNAHSIRMLLESVRRVIADKSLVVIFGCMADKDINSMLQLILPAAHTLIVTQSHMERAAPAEDLAQRVRTMESSAKPQHLHVVTKLTDAVGLGRLNVTSDDCLLITGSIALVGEARTVLVKPEHPNMGLTGE